MVHATYQIALRPCNTMQFCLATCLAMLENVALQVAEVWCLGFVTLCNFLINMSRNVPRDEKRGSVRMRPCYNCRKIARKVAGAVIHCAIVLPVTAIRCH